MAVRKRLLGQTHIGCSDCLVNLGIIYKLEGLAVKARACLIEALAIRKEGIGSVSLSVAQVLEELGKLELEERKFKESYEYLRECIEIRRSLKTRSDK